MDLYTEAAGVLEKFEKKQGTVKSLVFATGYKNIRQLYALVCESLKHQPILLRIFKESDSLQKESNLKGQPHFATVLLYEHLVGKGLGRAGRIRSCIVKHKREIQQVCAGILEEQGVASLGDALSSQCQALNKLQVPRYARVNLLKTTVADVVTAFTADGWDWRGPLSMASFNSAVESLGCDSFGLDPLLPDLLVFPPGTDLHDHPLTSAGNIILQDRASCFPAHVLNPPHGVTVLDCCAAPGNKTSHAASLMANSGKILAYERDVKRMSLLKQQLRKAGVTNTTPVHQDFLSVNPHDEQFADVQYILVDPSCSGSGIMSRMDHINNDSSTSTQRLLSLQRFQISILKHALHFPAAQRIVYSTCSIYEEENEAVIREVALQVGGKFRVKNIFPEFTHRGKGSDEISKCCLRMSPKKDLTNGFFVACFERVEEGEDTEAWTEVTRDHGSGDVEQKKHLKRKRFEDKEDIIWQAESEEGLNKIEHHELTQGKKRKKGKKSREEECSGGEPVQQNGQVQADQRQSQSQLPGDIEEKRKMPKSKETKAADCESKQKVEGESKDLEQPVEECLSVSIVEECLSVSTVEENTKKQEKKRKKRNRCSDEFVCQDKTASEVGENTTRTTPTLQFSGAECEAVSGAEETAKKRKKKKKKRDRSTDGESHQVRVHDSQLPTPECEPESHVVETSKKHKKKRKKQDKPSDVFVLQVKASNIDSGRNEISSEQTSAVDDGQQETDRAENKPKRKKKKKQK